MAGLVRRIFALQDHERLVLAILNAVGSVLVLEQETLPLVVLNPSCGFAHMYLGPLEEEEGSPHPPTRETHRYTYPQAGRYPAV